MVKGDWVSYKFRDAHGTLRSITGKVMTAGKSTVVVRSDGGQPGFPRGRLFTVHASDLELSGSPFAPHHKRSNPMTFGTSYFVSRAAAIRYYKPYHYEDTAAAVDRKLREGEIHIGKPPVKAGERLTTIDGGQRYAITEKNPRVKLPAKWTPANVRVTSDGDVQIGLSQNPMSAKGGRFAKCVKAVEAKGGAHDARAVCGAIEKRARVNPGRTPEIHVYGERDDWTYSLILPNGTYSHHFNMRFPSAAAAKQHAIDHIGMPGYGGSLQTVEGWRRPKIKVHRHGWEPAGIYALGTGLHTAPDETKLKIRMPNGRTFVRRGESVPRHYQPKAGEVWYVDGRRAVIKRVGESDGVPYVFFRRPVDGTLAMSVGNLIQAGRLATAGNPGKRARAERARYDDVVRRRGLKRQHGPRSLARFEHYSRSSAARGRASKAPGLKNPAYVHTYNVDIPATRYDRGYRLTIKAKTKASARAEAKRYCSGQWAKYTGRPASQYKLPAKTKVAEI